MNLIFLSLRLQNIRRPIAYLLHDKSVLVERSKSSRRNNICSREYVALLLVLLNGVLAPISLKFSLAISNFAASVAHA